MHGTHWSLTASTTSQSRVETDTLSSIRCGDVDWCRVAGRCFVCLFTQPLCSININGFNLTRSRTCTRSFIALRNICITTILLFCKLLCSVIERDQIQHYALHRHCFVVVSASSALYCKYETIDNFKYLYSQSSAVRLLRCGGKWNQHMKPNLFNCKANKNE